MFDVLGYLSDVLSGRIAKQGLAAPNVAARIREGVNGNPVLSPWLQFNAVAPLTIGVGGPPVVTDSQ